MTVFRIALLMVLIFLSNEIFGQNNTPNGEEPFLFNQYQIFLNEEIKKVKKIEYETEEGKLKGWLADDKSIIILENYNGRSRVKITYVDIYGETKSVSKSKCVIDPYQPL